MYNSVIKQMFEVVIMKNIRRIKRRNKGVVALVFLMFIAVVIIFSIKINNVNASKYYETKKIVVSESDTLWEIASDIIKENDNISIYTVIKDIKKLNNMTSSTIYVDQILEVYVY